jgi:serine/threonine-protein kinase HipA
VIVESLNVFFGQILTGILSLNKDRSFSFQYDQQWIESQDGFQLSVSLPIQDTPITGSHVRAFFANLLPESAARNRVARSLGLSEKNDFMLLKELGGDCAGAISLLLDGQWPELPEHDDYRPMSDEQLAHAIRQVPVRPLLAGEEGIRISLAGAQEKLALFETGGRFHIPLNNAPSNCILKPAMRDFDATIENECFCIWLARDMGLPVPGVGILRLEDQKALVVQRYDRKTADGLTVRLHQEDFCQALGLSHELKYQAEGGPGFPPCFQMVRKYSANPVKDVQLLLKWAFFNYLMGNMDGHAKNLSFLYHKRQIRLAPFYDLICTEIYEGLSNKLAMKIGNENRPHWVMERHWERMAVDIGLSPKVLKKHLAEFCSQLTDTLDTTVTRFIRKFGEHDLVLEIAAAGKKRADRTLK